MGGIAHEYEFDVPGRGKAGPFMARVGTPALLPRRGHRGRSRSLRRARLVLAVLGQQRVKLAELRVDDLRVRQLVGDDFLRLQAVAGDADDNALVPGNA